jgi:hypothetical protein
MRAGQKLPARAADRLQGSGQSGVGTAARELDDEAERSLPAGLVLGS